MASLSVTQPTVLKCPEPGCAWEMMPLSALLPGQSGNVTAVVGGGEEVRRLCELGLCRGAHVRMVQSGSSCIIGVGDRKLCVRGQEMSHVLVQTPATAEAV